MAALPLQFDWREDCTNALYATWYDIDDTNEYRTLYGTV